jgi:hypothetical protein
MTTAGKLESRFFWEYLNDGYLIYDRQRGAGCFGENFVATAVDLAAAEDLCQRLNLNAGWENCDRLRARAGQPFDASGLAR